MSGQNPQTHIATLKSKRNPKTGDVAVIFTAEQAEAILNGITPMGEQVTLPVALCQALEKALAMPVGDKGVEL